MTSRKFAVLSMDIEDWFHLDYFSGKKLDKSSSMLDGVINYIELLGKHNIKTTFFTLSELSDSAKEYILYAFEQGHEIACHGKDHIRPVMKDVDVFYQEIVEAKDTLSNLIGKEVIGYRAPCYSIDRERYDAVVAAGFRYSSSKIAFNQHPLYRDLDLSDFEPRLPGVYSKDTFYEFELSTQRFLRKNIPVSGGGYIRILPWPLMKSLISKYLGGAEIYIFYIHPFELSSTVLPKIEQISLLTLLRATLGRGEISNKIKELILLLKEYNFEFINFHDLLPILNKTAFNNKLPDK